MNCKCFDCAHVWENRFVQTWTECCPRCGSRAWKQVAIVKAACDMSAAALESGASEEVIEVKPSRKVHQVKIQKKLLAGEEYCRTHGLTFKVITEYELKGLGLL